MGFETAREFASHPVNRIESHVDVPEQTLFAPNAISISGGDLSEEVLLDGLVLGTQLGEHGVLVGAGIGDISIAIGLMEVRSLKIVVKIRLNLGLDQISGILISAA